jgi:hypothetical protein
MNKSDSIGKLALALSKLQGEVQNVYKDKQGYGYKYTELSSMLELTRPLCAKHELAVTQLCGSDEHGVSVETVLLHSSGEWLSKTFTLPILTSKTMSSVQGAGSSITYARRYALAALLGIAQTDDDATLHGEMEVKPASKSVAKEEVEANPQAKMTNGLKDKVGAPNQLPLARLRDLIKEHNLQEKEKGWLEHFKVASLDDLDAKEVLRLIKTVEGKV